MKGFFETLFNNGYKVDNVQHISVNDEYNCLRVNIEHKPTMYFLVSIDYSHMIVNTGLETKKCENHKELIDFIKNV